MKKLLLLAMLFPSASFAADGKGMIIGSDIVDFTGSVNGSNNHSTLTFNTTTDSLEYIDQVREATTITQGCFLYSARNAGNPPVHTITLHGVTTGTGRVGAAKTGANCSTFDPPADVTQDGTVQCCTFGTPYVAAAGEYLGLALTCAAGCDASNNANWVYSVTGNSVTLQNPYIWSIDGGAATRRNKAPVAAWKSASKTYGYLPISFDQATYNANSTPDEKALAFTLDSNWCSTVQLGGVRLLFRAPLTATSATVKLYSGTTLLASSIIYGDVTGVTAGANDRYEGRFYFDTAATLTCGTKYYIGVVANDNTSAVAILTAAFGTTGSLSGIDHATEFFYAQRTDAGAWTETTTSRPAMKLIINDWTAPSGGGGSDSQFNKGFN